MLYAERMVRKYAALERQLVQEADDARELRNHWIAQMRPGTSLDRIALVAGLSFQSVSRIAVAQTAAAPNHSGPGPRVAVRGSVQVDLTPIEDSQAPDLSLISGQAPGDDLPADRDAQLEQRHHGQRHIVQAAPDVQQVV